MDSSDSTSMRSRRSSSVRAVVMGSRAVCRPFTHPLASVPGHACRGEAHMGAGADPAGAEHHRVSVRQVFHRDLNFLVVDDHPCWTLAAGLWSMAHLARQRPASRAGVPFSARGSEMLRFGHRCDRSAKGLTGPLPAHSNKSDPAPAAPTGASRRFLMDVRKPEGVL